MMEMSDINDPVKYSKLAFSLDRIFKGMSVDSLKTKKVFVTKSTKREDEARIKINKIFKRSSNLYTKLPSVIIKENEKDKSRNEKHSLKQNTNSLISLTKRKTDLNIYQNPEPGKYNPNFKAIFKRVPTFKIRPENQITKINVSEDKTKNSNSYGYSDKYSQENSPIKNTKNVSHKKERVLDHIIKPRNFEMFVRSNNNPNVFSYIEPINYEKLDRKTIKSLDFAKMNDRNNIMINNNPGPAVCTYNPQFNAIHPDALKKVKTSKVKLYESKQFVVQKLWRSYNVALDYKTVQLEAFLKNDNELIK